MWVGGWVVLLEVVACVICLAFHASLLLFPYFAAGLSIDVHLERPVTRAGTLDYMSPEVLVCPDKRRPEENKDKVLLAYTSKVSANAGGKQGTR